MMKTIASVAVLGLLVPTLALADLYLVKTTEGPGFGSPDEAAEVLEKGIIPLFDALAKLEKDKVIVAGGLPAGSRTLYLMIEADSHDAVDRILRDLPGWGVFSWKVMPLQSLSGRARMERDVVRKLRGRD